MNVLVYHNKNKPVNKCACSKTYFFLTIIGSDSEEKAIGITCFEFVIDV